MTGQVEGGAAVRAEDAFDVTAMHRWLSRTVPELDGPPPHVTQFSGGASNLTYRLEYPGQELVLRRPPAGRKASSAHDVVREFRLQRRLRPHYHYVPDVVALCEDRSVIGSVFFVMRRVEGPILRPGTAAELDLSAERAAPLSTRAVDCLAELHQIDPTRAGLAGIGKGSGYVGRQVRGWSRRFADARTDNVPTFDSVVNWLHREQPADVATVLIHNDFRLDNLVLSADGDDIVGVLDWEMATLGDPLMDLGGALAYWVQADDDDTMRAWARQPSDLPGMITRLQIVERYGNQTGLTTDRWPFYEVFGLFRLAAIAQQIYYRYHRGQTTNPAFADLWSFVNYLEWRCRSIAGVH